MEGKEGGGERGWRGEEVREGGVLHGGVSKEVDKKVDMQADREIKRYGDKYGR